MKKFFFSIAIFALLAPALPAGAAGSCCVEKQANSDVVNACAKMTEASCPAGTTPIDCALEPKCSQFAQAEAAPSGATPAEFPIVAPRIPLNIPTVNVQDYLNVKQEEGYLHIPFISVFLVGAYKMGVGVAAVLAVIMIMVGGFIWIAASGDSGKIGRAKTMITSAAVGLLLTFGSYVVLQLVNPNLVNFRALKIPVVGTKIVEIIDDYHPETQPEPSVGGGTSTPNAPTSPSQFDSIFAKYAPCAGVTPEVLKAIATVESGLNPGKTNKSGYIGLFQTKQANCPANVAQYCTNLYDPDNNTAAGSAMIKKSVDLIKQRCPNASGHDQMVMIYVGHNMGYYMLQRVLASSCDVSTMRQATINAYVTKWPGTAASYSRDYNQKCLDQGKSAAECTGGPKFDYALRLADRSGVTQVIANSSGTCPY